jgi:superfamily II DNA or RNA helicase
METKDVAMDLFHLLEGFLSPENPAMLKGNIKWFSEARRSIIKYLTDEQIKSLSSKVKSRLQHEANFMHKLSNRWGLICMATGTGKSKTAIDAIKTLVGFRSSARILIVVPTAKLRDKTWKNEFIEWGAKDIWDNSVEKICYASLSKKEGCYYDLVIMDEVHNLTERSSDFFMYNEVKTCMALTATPPENQLKQMLLDKYRLDVIYEITLDEAVQLGVVAPYEITVIQTELDAVRTNVLAGSKVKQFYVTEASNYAYYAKIENSDRPEDQVKVNKFFYIRRMQFIYKLNSKLEYAKRLLKDYIPHDRRTIIFCGSTDHADELATDVYHSKRKKGDTGYDNFVNQISNRLACVEALNEGDNLPNVDIAFIEQLNSNRLDLIQRIGRILRFRVGHTGRIIILCAKDTVDAKWVRLALLGLDTSKIRWIEYNDLIEGRESLTF